MRMVQLDTTLSDLHATHGIHSPLLIDLYHSYTQIDLHANFPRETVYPEDEDPEVYGGNIDNFKSWALSFKTIRFLQAIGPAEVILYSPYNVQKNINRALDALREDQRPRIHYLDLNRPHMQKDLQSLAAGKKLVYWRPKSWMSTSDCLVDPEVSYEVNDKRFLEHPEIPTPPLQMLNLQNENERSILLHRDLPFIVKLCRCSSGQGTFIVNSEAKRQEMLHAMDRYSHRGGRDVQLTEFVHSARPHYGVNFFVPSKTLCREGQQQPVFLGASEQGIPEEGIWSGGTIDYSAQTQLEAQLRETINSVSKALQQWSYVGYAGVDVIFDKSGRPLVVDLNARMTGGMGTVFWSKHFLQLALPMARVDTIQFSGPAERVYQILSDGIESGQIIVALSTEVSREQSLASVVFGGKDRDDLKQMGQWIHDKMVVCLN